MSSRIAAEHSALSFVLFVSPCTGVGGLHETTIVSPSLLCTVSGVGGHLKTTIVSPRSLVHRELAASAATAVRCLGVA